MEYLLTNWTLGGHPELSLAEATFVDLRDARERLLGSLAVEETFDLLFANQEELERDLLSLALAFHMHPSVDISGFASVRRQLSRRFVNLLTTTRLYVDQVKHDLSTPFGPEVVEQFKRSIAAQYDGRLGFRVMEALRNSIQHRMLPITGITYHSYVDGGSSLLESRHTVLVTLDLGALLADPKFKRNVAVELEALKPEERNMVRFGRDYIEGIGQAHEELRARISASTIAADEVFHQTQQRWNRDVGPDLTGLTVVSRPAPGQPVEPEFPITVNATELRQELERRNVRLGTFSKRYASGQIAP